MTSLSSWRPQKCSDGHLVYPDLSGFRMVFTFHQVDVMAVEDVAMETAEVAAAAAEERAVEVEALEVAATVIAICVQPDKY